jgi:predicted enzyme related to lactoylglutathione lyase
VARTDSKPIAITRGGASSREFAKSIQLMRVIVAGFAQRSDVVTAKLSYAIEFVGDMNRAVRFYRDVIGLPLKFESPDWSEFSTGETTLALHPASDKNPAGKVEIGFEVPDLQKFHSEMMAKGVKFPVAPKKQAYGSLLAQFQDSEGASVSVSGK